MKKKYMKDNSRYLEDIKRDCEDAINQLSSTYPRIAYIEEISIDPRDVNILMGSDYYIPSYDYIEPVEGEIVRCDVADIADQVLMSNLVDMENNPFEGYLPGYHSRSALLDVIDDLGGSIIGDWDHYSAPAALFRERGGVKSEIHPHPLEAVLLGGARGGNRNRGRNQKRRNNGRPRRNRTGGRNGDAEDNRFKKPPKVIIRLNSEVVFRGQGTGVPRMWDTIIRAYDNALSRTRAAQVMQNWLYTGTDINPVSGGASTITGDGMRTLYSAYRVTGFDVDVTFTALEAFPVCIVLYPFGPFNTPTFTAVNTATLAEIQTLHNQRYAHSLVIGSLTGGSSTRTIKFKVTMDQLLGETGIDWRADDNFTALIAGTPANSIGLMIGAYTETSANWVSGIGVRMSFNTHVEFFSPIIQ